MTTRVIIAGFFALGIASCASDDPHGAVGSTDVGEGTDFSHAYRAVGQLVTLPDTGEVADIVAGERTAEMLSCTGETCVSTGRIAILASSASTPRSTNAADTSDRIVGYARGRAGGISNCGMTDDLMAAIDVVRDIAYGNRSFSEVGARGTKEIVVERAGIGAYVTVPITSFPQLSAQMMTTTDECRCIPGAIFDCKLNEYAGVRWCEKPVGCPQCELR